MVFMYLSCAHEPDRRLTKDYSLDGLFIMITFVLYAYPKLVALLVILSLIDSDLDTLVYMAHKCKKTEIMYRSRTSRIQV